MRSRRVVELLANAYNDRYTGSLILEDATGKLSAIRFVQGLVTQVGGAWQSEGLERGALSMFLPPEALELASRHAKSYGVDAFSAVEQLALLPPESVRAAAEALLMRGIELLSAATPFPKTRLRPGKERLKNSPTLDPPLPAWRCLVTAVTAASDSPAAVLISDLRGRILEIPSEAVPDMRACVTGPARAVVENLLRRPRSVEELEALDIVDVDRLSAILYALWLTGQLAPQANSRQPSQPPSGTPPTSVKEQALEAKVIQAWMRAEADESRVDKASVLAMKAVLLFPANARLRFFSACLHQRARRSEQARREFSKALELDPYYSDARRELAGLEAREAGKRSRRSFGRR